MEVVDDLNRKKNSAMGRLTKAKSEATSRARTAVENEFIAQGVASAASKKCEEYYENYGSQINDLTMEKIESISKMMSVFAPRALGMPHKMKLFSLILIYSKFA